jgi:hypothetical protein
MSDTPSDDWIYQRRRELGLPGDAWDAVYLERKRCAAIVRRFGNGDYLLGWDAEDVAKAIESGEPA